MGLKIKLPILFAALVSVNVCFAAASMDTRVMQLEKEMKDVRTETELGTYGMLTAPARPDVDGTGWFVSFSAIYQHAHIGGTEFCYTDDDQTASLPIHGRVKDIDFKWDWGLKAGLGYNFEHDNWDIYLNYTHLDTSGSRNISAGLNSSLIPLKGAASIVEGCSTLVPNPGLGDAEIPRTYDADWEYSTIANSQFEANFNIINLELGRNYFISSMLALRPHVGLQSTWIDLEQVSRYSGGNPEIIPTFETEGIITKEDVVGNVGLSQHTVDIKDDSDLYGLGPRVGVNTKWYLRGGFNLFGDVSGALLYARLDVDHREKFSLCPDANKIKLDANQHRVVPTAQFTGGLGYDFFFNEDKNHVMVRLGYDAQYFWRANQMLKIDEFHTLKYERYTEDVAIFGLTFDVRLDF